MHEIKPRSLRGRVGKTNSIAVCGSGTTGCHGYLQAHRIDIVASSTGAEGGLYFVPRDMGARNWMKLERLHGLESLPMVAMELAE